MGPRAGIPTFVNELTEWAREAPDDSGGTRAGGAFALVIAAFLVGFGAFLVWLYGPLSGRMFWVPTYTFFGLTLIVGGAAAALVGLLAILGSFRRKRLKPASDLLTELRAAPKPVRVCMRCRRLLSDSASSTCEACGPEGEIFLCETEHDVRLAAASLGIRAEDDGEAGGTRDQVDG